jgi:hypothetical protein
MPDNKLELDGQGPRYDVSNQDVLRMLQKGLSLGEAARRLGCSVNLVWRVSKGARWDPRMPKQYRARSSHPRCSCCKVRPVKKGNRFLCEQCFKFGASGSVHCDAVCHTPFD